MTPAPALFIGHGSPTLAVSPDRHAQAWADYGKQCPRPAAIAVISAHWVTIGTLVSSTATPETIHDFYGFPEALYREQYPASGAPAWAQSVCETLSPWSAQLDHERGLDHGAWAPLKYLFPDADIPVFQVSLDGRMSHADRYALGQALEPLRRDGLMILGSGNVVHNLADIDWSPGARPRPWAQRFESEFMHHLTGHDHQPLVENAETLPGWAFAHPHPDHYWPAEVALGALGANESISVLTSGVELGSISMLSWSSV